MIAGRWRAWLARYEAGLHYAPFSARWAPKAMPWRTPGQLLIRGVLWGAVYPGLIVLLVILSVIPATVGRLWGQERRRRALARSRAAALRFDDQIRAANEIRARARHG